MSSELFVEEIRQKASREEWKTKEDLVVPQLLSLSLCPVLSGVRNLPLWGSPMIRAGCWSLTSSVSGLFSLDSKLRLLCPTRWCLARISFLSAGTTGLPPGICSSAKGREYHTTQLVFGWLRLHRVRNIDEHPCFSAIAELTYRSLHRVCYCCRQPSPAGLACFRSPGRGAHRFLIPFLTTDINIHHMVRISQ